MRRRADKENMRQPAGVGELTMIVRAILPTSIAAVVLLSRIAYGQGPNPFEAADWPIPASAADAPVLVALQEQGLELRPPCSDGVFIRRVFIDVIGTLPSPQEVEAFLGDTSPDKRARLIDGLFDREEFSDYQTLKWCDILRVKSEFPIKLWPNAVQAYHAWVRRAIRDNMPYDRFARELLTSSGSNFRVAPANFYRAVQGRDPKAIAAAVALTFMGARFDTWPEAQQADLAAFFSKVAYKPTREWKEEIVYFDSSSAEPMAVTFPDGTTATIPANRDPREVFADWLVAPGNSQFSQAAANRAWYWLMGHGIVHEADDIHNAHPQVEPGEGRDVLIQNNRGSRWTDEGVSLAPTGPEGATLFLIDIDGGNKRTLPIGKPHTWRCQGHQCWIGTTGEILFTVSAGAEDVDGDPAAVMKREGNLLAITPGDERARVVATGWCFAHPSASLDGRFFVSDTSPEGTLIVGSLKTGKCRVLCESRTTFGNPQYTHPHPYFSPDRRWVIFNSTATGIPQIYAASVPEGLLEGLE